MGRNTRLPEGYAPLLEFYLRKQAEGGSVRRPGDLRGSLDSVARRTCLVLVHGFNNTESDAATAYLGFRNRQIELYPEQLEKTIENYFGDAFWPGDADWWWIFDKADFLVYPVSVHMALKAGGELYAMLQRMPNLQELDIIAHSLGCRVALEALLLLRKRGLPRVRSICLMAAAVPAEMLEPSGRFHELLVQLGSEGTRIEVLHSDSDTVLHYAFPPGQAAAGVGEGSLRALGRVGVTTIMPWAGSSLNGESVPGAKHGDYWGHSGTEPSKAATKAAGKFLGLGATARELGMARKIQAPPQDGVEPRNLSPERRIVGT